MAVSYKRPSVIDEQYIVQENSENIIYVCRANDIGPTLNVWTGQRAIDDQHVCNLYDSILRTNLIVGAIVFVTEKHSGRIRIIDGQHRLTAISRIQEKHPSFNPIIMFQGLFVSDIDSHHSTEYYKIANTSLRLDELPNDRIMLITQSVCNRLKELYPQSIVDPLINRNPNRPKTSSVELCNVLKKLLEKKRKIIIRPISDEFMNAFVNEFIKKVDEMNLQHAYHSLDDMKFHIDTKLKSFPKSVTQTISQTMFDRAKSSCWYLGLFPTKHWVTRIYKQIND